MTSNINPSAINTQIPVANSNNASADLRDNFAQIQNQFSIASSDISGLQNTTIKLGGVVESDAVKLTSDPTGTLVLTRLKSTDLTYSFNVPGTGALRVPVGLTAQRPQAGVPGNSRGMIRYNTDIENLEFYQGTRWVPFALAGPTGPAGSPTGATGPAGVGPTGPQGVTGAAGSATNTGATGPQGSQGPTGPQGIPGTAAYKGDTGPVGPTGPLGGPEGPTGPTGYANPGGPDRAVQFNNAGVFGGSADVTYDGTQLVTNQLLVDQVQINNDSITNILTQGVLNLSAKGQLAGVRVNNPGAGYTQVPAVTIEPPPVGGVQATAEARMGAVSNLPSQPVTPYRRGRGYKRNDLLRVSGGVSVTATLVRVDTVRIADAVVDPDNRGTGYKPGDLLVVQGGETPEPATIIVTRVRLKDPQIINAGNLYNTGDIVKVFGGAGDPCLCEVTAEPVSLKSFTQSFTAAGGETEWLLNVNNFVPSPENTKIQLYINDVAKVYGSEYTVTNVGPQTKIMFILGHRPTAGQTVTARFNNFVGTGVQSEFNLSRNLDETEYLNVIVTVRNSLINQEVRQVYGVNYTLAPVSGVTQIQFINAAVPGETDLTPVLFPRVGDEVIAQMGGKVIDVKIKPVAVGDPAANSYRELPDIKSNAVIGSQTGSGLVMEFQTEVADSILQNRGPYSVLPELILNKPLGGSGFGAFFNLQSEINTLAIADAGRYVTLPTLVENVPTLVYSDPIAPTVTQDCTINLSYGVIGVDVLNSGNGYTKSPEITVSDVGTRNKARLTAEMSGAKVSVGDLIVQGQAVGTAPAVTNVIYVTKDGDDANDGLAEDRAKRTIKAACAIAKAFTTIFVRAGDYLENNPIYVPERVAIIGDNLRRVNLFYRNPEKDFFWVNNAVYIAGVSFRGGKIGVNGNGYAIAFPPYDDPDLPPGVSGGAGVITTSPYVQNCTCFNSTGGGMRVDGDRARGLRSMVLDAFTQFNQGGPGIHITNQGYAQLVSIFTICTNVGTWVQNGGTCSISNSNTSFGLIGILAEGISPYLFGGKIKTGTGRFRSGTVTVNEITDRPYVGLVATLGPEYSFVENITVIDQGSGYQFEPTVQVDPPIGYAGTQAQILLPLKVHSASVRAGGTGYTQNDELTVVNGTGISAILRVTEESAGVITQVSVVSAGSYTLPPGPINVSVTGGTGNNAKFDLNLVLISDMDGRLPDTIFPTNGGARYTGGASVTIQDVTGENAIVAQVVYEAQGIDDIVNAGAGYKLGDLITIDGGSYPDPGVDTPTVLSVTGVTSPAGEVTSVSINTAGEYETLPIVSGQSTSTNGTGKGFLCAIDYRIKKVLLADRGEGYSSPEITVSGGGSSVAKARTGYDTLTGTVTDTTLISQGSGYIAQPLLEITGGGGSGATAISIVEDGSVTEIRITNPGENYSWTPDVTFTGGGGSGAQVGTIFWKAVTAEVANGGSGYRVNDLLFVVGGVGNPIRVYVTEVGAIGDVVRVVIDTAGRYSMMPSTVATPTRIFPETLLGAGCLLNLSLGIDSMSLASGGSSYVSGPKVRFKGGDAISLSMKAGKTYFEGTQNVVGDPPGQVEMTVRAMRYARDLTRDITSNTPVAQSQSGLTQYVNPAWGSGAQSTLVNSVTDGLFNLVINFVYTQTVQGVPASPYNGYTLTPFDNAVKLLELNKAFLQAETVAYINTVYPALSYNEELCYRDTGFILDAVILDTEVGGYIRSIRAGQAYWEGMMRVIGEPEVTPTLAALAFLKTWCQKIIQNNTLPLTGSNPVNGVPYSVNLYQTQFQPIVNSRWMGGVRAIDNVGICFDIMAYIINTATDGPALTVMQNTSRLLLANSEFIQAKVLDQVLSWDSNFFLNLVGGNVTLARELEVKCSRDVGYILDAVSGDMVGAGGTPAIAQANLYPKYYTVASASPLVPTGETLTPAQSSTQSASFESGKKYWSGAVSLLPDLGLANQKLATTTAINYVRDWALNLTQNITTPPVGYPGSPFQNLEPTVTNNSLTNGVQAVDVINRLFTNITSFINATDPDDLQADFDAAAGILQAQKTALQDDVRDWVNLNYPGLLDTDLLAKCRRDVGYLVDAVSNDIQKGGISHSIRAGRFYWEGAASELPSNQLSPTIAAINYLEGLIVSLLNTESYWGTVSSAVSTCFDIMTTIIQNGPALVGFNSASQLMRLNKQFLQAETRAYVSSSGFITTYLAGVPLTPALLTLCTRDVGYIVDALAADLVGAAEFPLGNTVNRETTISLEEVTDYAPLDGEIVNLYQVSVASASSHTFEYVGSGTDINTCLPARGGVPVQELEVVQRRGGRVYYTSTDHKGDFRIGEGLLINQNTGTLSGRVFEKSLFGIITPFVLSIEAGS